MNNLLNKIVEDVGISEEYLRNTGQWNLIEALATRIVLECEGVAACNMHVSGFALGDLIKQHWGVK